MGNAPCFHCGEALPDGERIIARLGEEQFAVCCIGCRAVAEFIHSSGLNSFYDFRSQPQAGMELTPEISEWQHFDADELLTKYVYRDREQAAATIDIGGMYCSACVWLLDNALQRIDGIGSVTVNPATRRAVIQWNTEIMLFSRLLAEIARIGFRPFPVSVGRRRETQDDEYKRALKRLIVAAAAGMQVMMFAVALYAGEYFSIQGGIEKFLRNISLLVTLPIVFYSARPFFQGAWRGLRAREPGMDLPVAIAISAAFLASLRATWLGVGDIYFDSVAMFVLFLSATRFLEMRARHRSDDLALALARLLPDTATRVTDGEQKLVALDRIQVGDIVAIRPGDVIPVDGKILTGSLAIDESMLTGESLPVNRSARDKVFAGGLNGSGNALLRVTFTGASTSLAEVARLLEKAKADRPPIALLADRIASRFVILVLLIAAATGAAWLQLDPARAFEVVLATLVVTCPCALALATPAALAAAASRLAREGFLLVRSRVLEVLRPGCMVVFDKTGTLSEGRPRVLETTLLAAAGDFGEEDCLALAAKMETASEHVLARAFAGVGGPQPLTMSGIQVESGRGVEASIDGKRYRIGNGKFVAALGGAAVPEAPLGDPRTFSWLGSEQGVLARFTIGDELREDARDTIARLKALGIGSIIASGDRQAAVQKAATSTGIDQWFAELSPSDKLQLVEDLQASGQKVVMVGDGVNDAPVLAAADASIALDAGTALARASADAIVLGKRLASVVDAASVAAATRRVIHQNIAWAIVYNLTAVPLAASGVLAPWMAALGMSTSSLLVVLNALRLHRWRAPGARPAGGREDRSSNQEAAT